MGWIVGFEPTHNGATTRCLNHLTIPTILEATPGFEPGNKGFADLCLTTWLWRRIQITKDAYFCVFCLVVNGAEDEIRTRDVHLGKVTLYH